MIFISILVHCLFNTWIYSIPRSILYTYLVSMLIYSTLGPFQPLISSVPRPILSLDLSILSLDLFHPWTYSIPGSIISLDLYFWIYSISGSILYLSVGL